MNLVSINRITDIGFHEMAGRTAGISHSRLVSLIVHYRMIRIMRDVSLIQIDTNLRRPEPIEPDDMNRFRKNRMI